MELTPIKIPEIPLPFDIPALMHPPIDHFIIALPIVVPSDSPMLALLQ